MVNIISVPGYLSHPRMVPATFAEPQPGNRCRDLAPEV